MVSMKLFLQLSEAQSTGVRWQRPLAEMAATWRCGILIKNLRTHFNSQVCVSFLFGIGQKTPTTISLLHCKSLDKLHIESHNQLFGAKKKVCLGDI